MAVKAGQAQVEITANTGPFWKAMGGLGSGLRKTLTAVAAEMRTLGPVFSGLGASIAGALGVALKYGGDAQEVQQRFAGVFGQQAEAMSKWAEEYAKVLGLGGGDVQGLLTTAQGMAVNLGMAEDAAAGMSTTLVQLASDMAATFGGTEEAMLGVLQAGLSGATRGLKRYGIAITDVDLEQTALQMGIQKSVKEMSEQEKVMVRLNTIVGKSGNMQGAAGRASGLWNRQMRALQSILGDIMEEIGLKLIPIMMPYVQMIRNVLTNTLEWVRANTTLVPGLVALARILLMLGGVMTAIAVGIAAVFSPAIAATIVWGTLLGGLAFAALRFFGVIDDGLLTTVGNMEVAGNTIREWWDSLMNWLLGLWWTFVGDVWTGIDFVAKVLKSIGNIGIYLYNIVSASLLRIKAYFITIFDGLYDYMMEFIAKGQKAWLDFQVGIGAISQEEYAKRWGQMTVAAAERAGKPEISDAAYKALNDADALDRVNAEMKFWPDESFKFIKSSLDLVNNELTKTERKQETLPGLRDMTGWLTNLFRGSEITIPKVELPNLDLGLDVPTVPADAQAGGGTRGGFGGDVAGMLGLASGTSQQQLNELKKQTSILEKINTGIGDMEATYA